MSRYGPHTVSWRPATVPSISPTPNFPPVNMSSTSSSSNMHGRKGKSQSQTHTSNPSPTRVRTSSSSYSPLAATKLRSASTLSSTSSSVPPIPLQTFTSSPNFNAPSFSTSPSANATSTSTVETEYISNLQLQIYFLELELNLLKKSSSTTTAEFASFNGVNGANKNEFNQSLPINPDAPLDDVMTSLRAKFISLQATLEKKEQDWQKERQKMHQELEVIKIEKTTAEQQRNDSEELVTLLTNTEKTHRQNALEAELQLEQRSSEWTTKLKDAQFEFDSYKKDTEVTITRQQADLSSCHLQIDESEKEIQHLRQVNVDWKTRYEEILAESLEVKASAEYNSSRDFAKDRKEFQAELVKLNSKLRTVESQLEIARSTEKHSQETIASLEEEVSRMQSLSLHLQDDYEDLRREIQCSKEMKEYYSTEVADWRSQALKNKENATWLESRLQDMKTKYEEEKKKNRNHKSSFNDLENQMKRLDIQLKESRKKEQDYKNDLLRLQADHTILLEELQTRESKVKQLLRLEKENQKWKFIINQIEKEREAEKEMNGMLKNINWKEFLTFTEKNAQMMSSIQGFMKLQQSKVKERGLDEDLESKENIADRGLNINFGAEESEIDANVNEIASSRYIYAEDKDESHRKLRKPRQPRHQQEHRHVDNSESDEYEEERFHI